MNNDLASQIQRQMALTVDPNEVLAGLRKLDMPLYDYESKRVGVPAVLFSLRCSDGGQCDINSYLYLKGDAEMGLDPWRDVVGYDELTRPLSDGASICVQWGRTSERTVRDDFLVYISERDFVKLYPQITEAHQLLSIKA